MNLCITDLRDIPVYGKVEYYVSGNVRSCAPAGRCLLDTEAGQLVPQFSTDDLRRKTVQAVHFHENGNVRSLPLEEKTPVFTPAGIISAEMLTFYESGKVKRVFPLNGKLSGYWTQEDEEQLAELVAIDTPVGALCVKVISICFHESGVIRSITLWPGETVSVPTPSGEIKVRSGLSFSREGRLVSVEPAEPTEVVTRIGKVTAFDYDSVGINGDVNSLVFDKDGNIARLSTSLTSVAATHLSGSQSVFIPEYRDSLCGSGEKEVTPMTIDFGDAGIEIVNGSKPVHISYSEHEISTSPFLPNLDSMFGELKCSI